MTHGSLFSGIGGFDLAAEWMGWDNKFHCEWNEFGQKVLKYYWPDAESFTDITKTDFTKYANRIDILTGGFPCQPYSLAGKRKGKEDERHLWPEMLRAIREIKPRWVVGENVFGLINWSDGLVFHEVQTDLEAAGYEVWPYVLPACAVNAPHRRDRVWFVAYCSGSSRKGELQQRQKQREFRGCDSEKITPNPHSDGFNGSNSKHEINPSEGREYAQRNIEQMGGNAPDTDGGGSERHRHQFGEFSELRQGRPNNEAICNNIKERRNATNPERIGSPGQKYPPVGPGQHTKTHTGCRWQNFPTQSPICTGNDGFFSESLRQRIREDSMGYLSEEEIEQIFQKAYSRWRNESIKAAGNAIVPQVALQIFKAIEQYEQQNS